MIRGLIGNNLSHSYSKQIHKLIINDEYNLYSLSEEMLDIFMKSKNFDYINVTIPYKETVLKYLDHLSEEVKLIGASNLVVNREGKLYGYNTDYLALRQVLKDNNISLSNKNILVLGSGGTSKMVQALLKESGAKTVSVASRTKKGDKYITYDEVYTKHFNIIFNTTPVGMYPDILNSVISLDRLNTKELELIVDCIYNPTRTILLQDARSKHIKTINGLSMLVYQAIYSYEIFKGIKMSSGIYTNIYHTLISKNNLVLTGMPGSGKSAISKFISELLANRVFVDIDSVITSRYGDIMDIFRTKGEKYFREIEKKVIAEYAIKENQIIATGGGSILDSDNVKLLKSKGTIFFINRPIEEIEINDHRPLVKSMDDLFKIYKQRISIYRQTCDYEIMNNDIKEAIKEIIKIYID